MIRVLMFGFMLLLISCDDDRKSESSIVLSSGYKKLEIASQLDQMAEGYEDVFSEISLIPIGVTDLTDDPLFLASIDKIEILDKEIVLLDKKLSQLMVCGLDGKLKMKIGKLGSGPAEFQEVNDFVIDEKEDEIVAFSNSDLALYFFSSETGDFIKKEKTGMYGYQVEKTDRGNYLLYLNHNSSEKGGTYNVILMDARGEVSKRFFLFDPEKANAIIPYSGFLRKTEGSVYFSPPFYNSIFKYNPGSMEFEKAIELDINSALIEENKNDFRKKNISDKRSTFLGNIFFKNEDFILFNCSYRASRRIGIYDINKSTLKLFGWASDDPFFKLIEDPLYLDDDNYAYFGVSSDRVHYLKEKHHGLYLSLDDQTRKILDQVDRVSYYLLKVKLKNL